MKIHRRHRVINLSMFLAAAVLGALGCGAPFDGDGDVDVVHAAVSPPSDPRFRDQWALRNTGQDLPTSDGAPDLTGIPGLDMNVLKAWDVTLGSSSVVVAVIDEGLADITHPDLVGNVLGGVDFIGGNPSFDRHATHMAGIIAAQLGNGEGMVGVAPRVRVLPLRAKANDDTMVKAINYAKMMGAKIVSVSQGGLAVEGYNNAAVMNAMRDSGLLFVCSAGNVGCVGSNNVCRGHADLNYPSSFDLPNVISVANIDSRGELAPTSFYGETNVDIAAPGSGVLGPVPGGEYTYAVGTSEAAPQVAGVAALIASKFPNLGPTQIIDRIMGSGMRITFLDRLVRKGTMVDASAALGDLPPITLDAASVPGRITLTWNPVSHATRYLVERDGTQVDAGNNTTFVHANLVVDSPHFYRVRALVDGTYGPWSHRFMKRASQEPQVEAYSKESLHPYVRDDFNVFRRNAKRLRVHFATVATAPGDELTWEVFTYTDTTKASYRGTYQNGFWSNWVKDDRFDFSLQGSGTAPAYGFRIDKIEFVATVPDKPDAPLLNDSGPTSITIGFASTGGSNFVNVYRSTAAFGGYVRVGQVAEDQAAFEDQPVDRSRTFYYRVSCLNDLGESAQSDFLKVPAL